MGSCLQLCGREIRIRIYSSPDESLILLKGEGYIQKMLTRIEKGSTFQR